MIEIDIAVTPPGLKGLNALAMRLNSLVTAKKITAWHLARWKDRSQTSHGIYFENIADSNAAVDELRRSSGSIEGVIP
jgi:uncharacterized protein YdaL